MRSAVSWILGIALPVVGFVFPSLLPWWGWLLVGSAWFGTLIIVGRRLTDRDLRAIERED
ncbi:hypothetical protein [Leifsonia sp. 2MCAF36]|uniref:hypothetical protein n=1 Tax=Leifsonia sp. 2MCAF36 TaxID=3232988 RepID=UPI003F9CAFB7